MRFQFVLGFGLAILMVGCAGFSYRYYGLEDVNYSNGKLLSDKPENDLPFMRCAPSESTKHPCVVLFAPEFFKMKQDFEDTKQKLEQCERGRLNANGQ